VHQDLGLDSSGHYNYFRDYDPAIGRYVQSDPIGLAGGLSTYAYVSVSPLVYRDVKGLMKSGEPDPPPHPIIVNCPKLEGHTFTGASNPITRSRVQCFPVFHPETRRQELVCVGNGTVIPGWGTDRGFMGWECTIECIYRRNCDNLETRREGTCIRAPRETRS
jgi:RHS repeat-associated protein